jgi:citrate synthase
MIMQSGLDSVIAAETILSDVDGANGVLIIRGQSLDHLAGRWSYEQAAHLLFDGWFAGQFDGQSFAAALGAARAEVFKMVSPWIAELAGRDVYEAMRVGTALIADGDDLATALQLLAVPAVMTTALLQQRAGAALIAPDPALSHAQDIVRMLGIDHNQAKLARALDAYLVTVCDHGLNASTFAARVVASTLAGLTSSVVAGMSALKGPLHGGAPGPVIAMLDAMALAHNPKDWLATEVARGERLMGFGHRIYRVRDPRADALKAAVRRLGTGSARLAFAEQAEQMALAVLRQAKPDRVLETNVEFYTAVLLEAVGFPPDSFTCVFAMGRTAGWIAHAREQQATGRLIRPQSRYIGPMVKLAA